MRKQKTFLYLTVLTTSLLISVTGNAATRSATSCSQAHVQAAINAASTGDSVLVPAGNCTWSTAISIMSTKKILLQGAGIDSTVITSSDGTAVDLADSGSRLTGFTFNESQVLVYGEGWRIDHCKFYRAAIAGEGVQVRAQSDTVHPTGVVDHCYFYNTRVIVVGPDLLAHALWAQPLNLGSGTGVVYVEDCTYQATDLQNAIDTNYGGRYVFRYNTLTDVYVEAHSVQSSNRAARKWEIYHNTFNQVTRGMWVPMFLRGGTGVVFDNVLTGTWTVSGIALNNVRSCSDAGVPGKCDGSSPWDGNQAGGNGYPCRDQIGRSTDAYLWTDSKPYPPQALDPAYAWNNKHGANDVLFFQHGCAESAAHIQPGRDYFNNIPKPGYTPYTYPHPLVSGWSPATVEPPRNLHVVEWTTK